MRSLYILLFSIAPAFLMSCADSSATVCEFGDYGLPEGQWAFSPDDGCNVCSCKEDGTVSCSALGCTVELCALPTECDRVHQESSAQCPTDFPQFGANCDLGADQQCNYCVGGGLAEASVAICVDGFWEHTSEGCTLVP